MDDHGGRLGDVVEQAGVDNHEPGCIVLRTKVAIKILPPHLTAGPERRARFAREARLLARLDHPHIGAIYGLDPTFRYRARRQTM